MSTRCEFAQTSILNFYRKHQRIPEKIRMHPVFERAIRQEAPWAFGRDNFCDGTNTFGGVQIERTPAVHSCECTHSEVHP